MPRVTHNPDAEAVLYVRVPGVLKDAIADQASREGLSINAWCANVLRLGLRREQGLPDPPTSQGVLPTIGEVIGAYARGEQVVLPCGKQGTCAGLEVPREVLHGVEWCGACGIRLG